MRPGYIDEFIKIAKAENKKCNLKNDNESYIITVAARTKTGVEHELKIQIFYDGVVSITGSPIPFIPARKRNAVIREVNKINREFRFYKLFINDKGALCASYDLLAYSNINAFGDILMGAVDAYIYICEETLIDVLSIAFGNNSSSI